MKAEFAEVRLNKTDEELIDKIARCRDKDRELIKKMMRHSCWMQKQYADLTGKSVQTINNLMVYGKRKDNKNVRALNVCMPFPNFGGTDSTFIMRDELSMEYLLKSLK